MRNEAFYKLKLIDFLYTTKLFNKNSVIADEIPVNSFKRRADLLLLDDKIHLFEIKSDIDSLGRLEGQLDTYMDFSDQVTILCSPCHATQIQKQVSKNVGIWVLDEKDQINILRTSKVIKIRKKSSLLKYMNVVELRRTLSNEGLRMKSSHSTRIEMLSYARKIKIEVLRSHVLKHLKYRYSEKSTKLYNELRTGVKITKNNLSLLDRKKIKSITPSSSKRQNFSTDLFLTRMLKNQNNLLFGPVPNHLLKYIAS